jgi:hypothetical protein
MVAGSKNCYNYGHDTWFPGDRLTWRMPSINSKTREEERKRLPLNREHPPMRDRAIIEVLSFEKAHHFLREALTLSFDTTPEKAASHYSFTRLVPGADDHLGGVDRSIIALRNFLQLHSFHTIAVMLAYGLSPDRVPGEGVQPFDPSNYNANPGLEALDLTKILKKVVPARGDDGRVDVSALRDMSSNELDVFSNKLLYWAGKFGLLGSSVPEYIKPAMHLVNQTIGLTMRPWLLNQAVHDYFSILRFFPDSKKQGVSVRSRNPNDLSRSYNLRVQVGALAHCQSSLAKDFSASIGYAIEKRQARVMFTSLNLTAPGDFGDTYR